jgi:hypothetical protein
MSKAHGFLLEFIPVKTRVGLTFLEAAKDCQENFLKISAIV